MPGRDEEQKKGEGKGFAGLSSLVSDVDTRPPPAAKAEPAATAPSTERPTPQTAQPQPSQQHQTYQESAQPSSSESSGGKWALGIAAVIGALWLVGQSDKNATSPDPTYSPPAQTATPSYSPPPAKSQAPSRTNESMPPAGQNLVFSADQIRYCLAEDIRMDAAKSAVDNHIESDVNRFNAMVADYNSRCGNFRYRSGALESAQQDIEPYRSQLRIEGKNRFLRAHSDQSESSINRLHASDHDFGTETYETSYDCTKARSIPEHLICHDPVLAASDRELAAKFELAKNSISDISALRQRARKQWNYREKNCKDRECVADWYEYQKATWDKILQTGDVNAKL